MNKSKLVIIIILLSCLFTFNSTMLANNLLPFQNYKLAVKSFEAKNLEKTKQYLDQIILNDLTYSNYLAKAIYLKTIILAAEIERNMELKKVFKIGRSNIALSAQQQRAKFENKLNNYQLAADRKVDTLVGLANYLVSNLPPVEMNLNYSYNVGNYDAARLSQIKSGTMPKQSSLKKSEEDLLAKKINHYLKMTLGVRGFNNVSTIRADKGDSLYSISKDYQLPFYLVLSVNNQLKNPSEIYPGQKIYLPQTSSTYINYPAYFYYLSELCYQVNPKRREAVMRLVVKAYHLTNKEEPIDKQAQRLADEVNLDQYKNKFQKQSRLIKKQNKKLELLKEKYNQLLYQLQKIKSNFKETKQEDKSNNDHEFDLNNSKTNKNYDVSDDPLTYE
ncbi:LysM domain-containing protein [Halobacteroides halobius DSM 5150]|uniref:LysM domain-containing protein n=1 Tax=Halobacteroides halobius (strain ATCC 35273 / DSM 5150 / MD-1) TaxID=748449 RepID=L0KAI5_HALHC|nr:LysM peptidoglycan-binding domain-containing protein [Halobacteroides halobius]AGB41560.1 LysM domain-containing protein [Halobacteroides halobius DSM 5150]